MPLPRPSLMLVLDIDERLATEELKLEINRCYAHVCQTLVRTHSPEDPAALGNVARFHVRMGAHRYLDAEAEGSAELWSGVVERWISNELFKVSNNMRIFNDRQREEGRDELMFDWYEIVLQNGELSVLLHCDSSSAVDPAEFATVAAVRNARCGGALGGGAVRVLAPAPQDFERQRAACLAVQEQQEGQTPAQDATEHPCEDAGWGAEDSFLEPQNPQSKPAPATSATGKTPDECPKKPALSPDYHVWLVEYADGSSRLFDSAAMAFMEDGTASEQEAGA